MPDRDHELLADEDHHLAGLDHLRRLGQLAVRHVAGGPQHQEVHRAELLQLGPLLGLDRVLDGQLVQAVGAARSPAISSCGGLVQAEPDEGVVARAGLAQRLVRSEVAGLALAVDVDAAVDHRAAGADCPGRHGGLGRRWCRGSGSSPGPGRRGPRQRLASGSTCPVSRSLMIDLPTCSTGATAVAESGGPAAGVRHRHCSRALARRPGGSRPGPASRTPAGVRSGTRPRRSRRRAGGRPRRSGRR